MPRVVLEDAPTSLKYVAVRSAISIDASERSSLEQFLLGTSNQNTFLSQRLDTLAQRHIGCLLEKILYTVER